MHRTPYSRVGALCSWLRKVGAVIALLAHWTRFARPISFHSADVGPLERSGHGAYELILCAASPLIC
jgi:hypothetical protein